MECAADNVWEGIVCGPVTLRLALGGVELPPFSHGNDVTS